MRPRGSLGSKPNQQAAFTLGKPAARVVQPHLSRLYADVREAALHRAEQHGVGVVGAAARRLEGLQGPAGVHHNAAQVW